MAANVPSTTSTMVAPGTSVARRLRRNRPTINTTSPMVRTSVNSTSFTEAWIVVVRFSTVSRVIAAGRTADNAGNFASMRWTVSMTFAPGWR